MKSQKPHFCRTFRISINGVAIAVWRVILQIGLLEPWSFIFYSSVNINITSITSNAMYSEIVFGLTVRVNVQLWYCEKKNNPQLELFRIGRLFFDVGTI